MRMRRDSKPFELALSSVFFFLLALLPVLEVIARTFFDMSFRGINGYVRHAVLWIGCLAGMIASRDNSHLNLVGGHSLSKGRVGFILAQMSGVFSLAVTIAFGVASLSFLLMAFLPGDTIGIFPSRLVMLILPISYLVMAMRFTRDSTGKFYSLGTIFLGLLLGLFLTIPLWSNLLYAFGMDPPGVHILGDGYYGFFQKGALPLVLLLLVSLLGGTPIFIFLGGVAYFLFSKSWAAMEVLPNEGYNLLVSSTIPTIPLFTLTGFIMSESKSGERLIRFFKSFLGGLPGGMAVVAVMVSAFFTAITGASGVTILALGGVLAYLLKETGEYDEDFIQGLLTSSGSIGLLFPPSLPVIIYAVTAQFSALSLYKGGIIPGIILMMAVSTFGVMKSLKSGKRGSFNFKDFFPSLKSSSGEIILLLVVVVGYFGGVLTLIETAAVSVIYILILEVLIHRDLGLRDLVRVMEKSLPIIGGILVILMASKGLSYYLVDARIPLMLTAFVREYVQSPLVFLMLLNLALLLVGCLMDIYSAILVVVPLILPMGEAFGIHPVQLGIIFLANLQLGYLTPPVGMNLFLASYRFDTPLFKVYRQVLPFLLLLLAVVVLITYVPWFSLAFL